MNKREIVKSAMAHKECGKVPYSIALSPDAYKKYGDAIIERYGRPEIVKALEEGIITKVEAICLSMGNYIFFIKFPWWSWYEVPPSYRDFDAPEELPKTIGTGSYEQFFNKITFVKENFDCYIQAIQYGSHFEKANSCRGIENFLADLGGNQDFARELLNFIIKKNLVMIENVASHPAIDGILLGSDWGSQQSLLMSPAVWRELIAPGELQEYRLIKKNGKDVWIHSCGNVEQIIPDLIEMGVDVLNPIQPECMNIYHLKEKYGSRITYWGGVSTQQTLPYGTPEDVRKETEKVITSMSKNGGYITGPGQDIQVDVPYENLIAFLDCVRQFG